jgi:hypothetical protein
MEFKSLLDTFKVKVIRKNFSFFLILMQKEFIFDSARYIIFLESHVELKFTKHTIKKYSNYDLLVYKNAFRRSLLPSHKSSWDQWARLNVENIYYEPSKIKSKK